LPKEIPRAAHEGPPELPLGTPGAARAAEPGAAAGPCTVMGAGTDVGLGVRPPQPGRFGAGVVQGRAALAVPG